MILFGPIISSATKKSDVVKRPRGHLECFLITLCTLYSSRFPWLHFPGFPPLLTCALPVDGDPPTPDPSPDLPTSSVCGTFFVLQYNMALNRSCFHVCMSVHMVTKPTFACTLCSAAFMFRYNYITQLCCLILYGRLSQEFTNGNNTEGNLLHR